MEEFVSPGSKFYLAFFNIFNHMLQSSTSIKIRVSNLEQTPQNVSIKYQFFQRNITIPPFYSEKISLNSTLVIDDYNDRNNAIVVQSLDQGHLSVTSFKYTVGIDFTFVSSDTFHVLPSVYLPGKYEYYAMSSPSIQLLPQICGVLVIVATEDNTKITLTMMQNVTVQSGTKLIKGIPHTLTLRRAETFSTFSKKNLIGSHIISNKPISVFSGQQYNNSTASEYIQIPPTSTWGMEFYIVPIKSSEFTTFGFISSRNNTILRRLCKNDKTFNVQTAMYFSIPLEVFCHIKSSHPVLLVIVFPIMDVVPPVKQYRNFYIVNYFNAHNESSKEQHFLNVIFLKSNNGRDGRNDLLLNGEGSASNQEVWTDIQCIPNFEETCAYAIQLELDKNETIYVSHPSPQARFFALPYTFNSTAAGASYSGMTQLPIACKL